MRVVLGAEVSTSDGEKFGSIEGFVVDGGNLRVTPLLIRSGGLIHTDRLIGLAVFSSLGYTATLSVSKEQAEEFPTYIRRQFTVETPRTPSMPLIMPASGVGGPVMAEPIQGSIDYRGTGSIIESAPLSPNPSEVLSNLLESQVIIRGDASVIGADGEVLGGVECVDLNGDGDVITLTMGRGVLATSSHDIPGSEITAYGDNRVHVSLTKASLAGK